MLKGAHIYRRLVLPGVLVVLMSFAFAPAAFAASNHSTQPDWSNGLKQHYLALGDLLAYGYQPCIKSNTCTNSEGYVYRTLPRHYRRKESKTVTNLWLSW